MFWVWLGWSQTSNLPLDKKLLQLGLCRLVTECICCSHTHKYFYLLERDAPVRDPIRISYRFVIITVVHVFTVNEDLNLQIKTLQNLFIGQISAEITFFVNCVSGCL